MTSFYMKYNTGLKRGKIYNVKTHYRSVFKTQTFVMEFFNENTEWLKTVNYFFKEVPSQMLNIIRNTPLHAGLILENKDMRAI